MRERVSTDATAETQSMTMNSAPYYNIDKTLFSNARSIGGLFLLVKELLWDIMDRKARAGDAVGKGRWCSGRSYEKSAHLLVESPATKDFSGGIQTDPSCTPQILEES